MPCRAMVKSMTEANRIPTFHFCDDLRMDNLIGMRKLLQQDPALRGLKLTYLPFIMKALSAALLEYPLLNGRFEEADNEVVQLKHHNIGVAMATPGGLVVPNIKQVSAAAIAERFTACS